MLEVMTLVLLLAETTGPASQTTLPRRVDPPAADAPPVEQRLPTDPLYDKPQVATDDAAFVLSAVETVRQGASDAKSGAAGLPTPALRALAETLGQHQMATLNKLETLAGAKGWRLPAENPGRTGSVPVTGATRTSADFIVHQIAFHETVVDQYRAQIAGPGDAELKRVLRAALPGYQKNLQLLLAVKP
jgi:hypothetical protein